MVALKEKKTMSLRTPVTDLFGTEFPIVAGGICGGLCEGGYHRFYDIQSFSGRKIPAKRNM